LKILLTDCSKLNNIFHTVFSNFYYVLTACVIFTALFVSLSIISEFIFLEPYLVFAVYNDTAVSLLLIVILSALSGIAISMNIYRVKIVKETRKMSGSIIGTIIGASAGACSCGPIAFSIIATFGTVGSVASSFLTTYEIPIRITSIGILLLVIAVTSKSLSNECKVNI
tara:strand:- start:855 stop:1361 length:507 start_codon:yes stop_codon:yes gene_type:complete